MAYVPAYYPNNYAAMGGTSFTPYAQQPMSYNNAAIPVQQPTVNNNPGMIWVDGEVGAKAYQIPVGVTGPVALWDTNDQIIYLKSVNQFGMPNPLQKIKYQMEETPLLQSGQMSGSATASGTGSVAENYVTKEDFDALKNEIREMIKQNQYSDKRNGNQFAQNKGGDR